MLEISHSDPSLVSGLDEYGPELYWEGNSYTRNPGSHMWQVITGHKNIVDIADLDAWVDPDGKIMIPPSELGWYSTDGKTKLSDNILGLSPENLLEPSLMGVTDHRMVALTDDAYEEMKSRLNDSPRSKTAGYHVRPNCPLWSAT